MTEPGPSRLRRLDEGLWTAEAGQRFVGLEIGARMTVVQLGSGGLLLHSPVEASAELVREVVEIGPVNYLVAPNLLHHMYLEGWQEACPGAATYVAPGLLEKRPELSVSGILEEAPHSDWASDVDQIQVAGFPFASEVVFFHRSSRTLILTDLAFRIGPESPFLTRTVFRAIGGYGSLSPSLLEKVMIRDRQAFRHSLERVLEWPFARVIVAHGDICETGGREELTRSYTWILNRSETS